MQTERIDLHYQQGSSDKVYHLQLETVEGSGPSTRNGGGAVPACRATRRQAASPTKKPNAFLTACCGKRRAKATAWPKRTGTHPRLFRLGCRRRNSPVMHPNC